LILDLAVVVKTETTEDINCIQGLPWSPGGGEYEIIFWMVGVIKSLEKKII